MKLPEIIGGLALISVLSVSIVGGFSIVNFNITLQASGNSAHVPEQVRAIDFDLIEEPGYHIQLDDINVDLTGKISKVKNTDDYAVLIVDLDKPLINDEKQIALYIDKKVFYMFTYNDELIDYFITIEGDYSETTTKIGNMITPTIIVTKIDSINK